MHTYVFIATSIDGFIARIDGSIDWLTNIDNPDNNDYGYTEFIENIDAIIMGRNTYESVKKIEPWPYNKPVFVLSSTLKSSLNNSNNKITIVNLKPKEIIDELMDQGFKNLYIDGGKTIQSFLNEDLIDELIITKVPILLGSGIPLFGYINKELKLKHINTVVYNNGLVKSRYICS